MSETPEEFEGRYVTEAVESGVFDASGDLLGHVGLLDVEDVDVHTARDMARSLPGPTALLQSSPGCYHVWSLAVRPLSEWLGTVEAVEGVDGAHVELSEARDCSVLRLDRKVSVETGETVKPRPRLLGSTETVETGGPLSAPHARLLREEFGATVDTSVGKWTGESVDKRVFMARIGGGE